MSNIITLVGAGRTFLSTNDLFIQANTNDSGQVEIVLPNSKLIFGNSNSNTAYNYIGVRFVDIGNNASIYNIVIYAFDDDLINGQQTITINTNGGGGIINLIGEGEWAFEENTINLKQNFSVTYSELADLVNSSKLIPQQSYLINDYQTIYDQPDFDSFGVPKLVVPTLSGSIEPLVVNAITTNELSTNAKSTIYPLDLIEYIFNSELTPVMGVPNKGKIVFRQDDLNNKTYYDSRVVLFKRYETSAGSGEFSVINDNGETSNNTLTFTDGSYNIQCDLHIFGGLFGLPNNIFSAGCYNIQTGNDFYNNTILNILLNDTYFGDTAHDNVFLGGGYNNNVQNSFNSNRFESAFQNNHIQNGFRSNVFTGVCTANSILSGFRSNIIGDFVFNTIGYDFAFNTIGSAINNKISDNFQQNTIGINITNNNIFNNFINNTLDDNFQGNDIRVATTVVDASWLAQTKVYLPSYCIIINGFDAFGVEDAQPILGFYDTSTGLFSYSGL